MSAEQPIIAAIREIANRKPQPAAEIHRTHRLIADLNLDSMDIAELVAILEERLGKDPFAETASIADVHTVDDLIVVYDAT